MERTSLWPAWMLAGAIAGGLCAGAFAQGNTSPVLGGYPGYQIAGSAIQGHGVPSSGVYPVIPSPHDVAHRTQLTSANSLYAGLESRVTALEARQAEQPNNGWEDTHDQKWKHKWGGRVQGDYVMFAQEPAGHSQENYFEFRRLRLYSSGTGYGVYDYKLQLEFEPEPGRVSIKDIWLGIDEIPILGYVRAGHFYAPFSIEMLTSSKYVTFLERSIPTEFQFAPGREVGIAAVNHTPSQDFTWAYGVYFDDISDVLKERIDDNQGTTGAARLTWTPYYDEPSDGRYLVHTGVGVVYTDDQDNNIRFRGRPQVHEGNYFIDTGTFTNADEFTVMGAELATVWGPFSVQSELMWTQTDTGDTGLGSQGLYGAYVFASYFLTGENRVYDRRFACFGRVKPLENFWIVRGAGIGTGAGELKARWSYLDFSKVGRGTYNDLTCGFNWYWNPYARMMFDWIHPFTNGTFADADAAPADFMGDTESDIVAMRMEFNF